MDLTFKQVVADICKFVTDECADKEGKFFDSTSDLAANPKYETLRNWRTRLNMSDYTLFDIL